MNDDTLQINCETNLEIAQKLWKEFTQDFHLQGSIFDSWDVRYCFYKYFHYPLYFYTAYDQGIPVGLLPLQWNEEKKHLEFFGGDFIEDNRCLVKSGYESVIPRLYGAIDRPANLEYIVGNDPYTTSLPIRDYKYTLSGKHLTDYWGYLHDSGHTSTRRTLQQQIRRVEKRGVEVVRNNFSDIELLFEYNIKVFGERSVFNRPWKKEIFRDLLHLPYQIFLLSFVSEGSTLGVSLAIQYKNIFACFNTGADRVVIPDLNKYIYYTNLSRASDGGQDMVLDFFTGNYGYKELWFFEKNPQYMLTLP